MWKASMTQMFFVWETSIIHKTSTDYCLTLPTGATDTSKYDAECCHLLVLFHLSLYINVSHNDHGKICTFINSI